jgi:hypothetical protein
LIAVRLLADEGQLLCREVHRADLAAGEEWWPTLSKALADLPRSLHGLPCTLVLPHNLPLVKWVALPAVEPFLLRATLADALGLDQPFPHEDYVWDHIGASGDGHYVFAEQRVQLAPIFDLLATAGFYPDGAIPPLMADFSRALRVAATRTSNLLHLGIGEGSTTLILTGGKRPYLRYVNFGWDRLFADGEGDLGGERWARALRSWLAGQKVGDEDLQRAAERRGMEFFTALHEEILRTEMHQIHHLGGKHFPEFFFYGSGDNSLLLQLLQEKYRAKGHAFQPEDHCTLARSVRARAGRLDSLIWMRLLEAGTFQGSVPCPFLPQFIRRRKLAAQVRGVATAATALLWGMLLVGIAYHGLEGSLLAGQRQELVQAHSRATVLAKRYALVRKEEERLVENFTRIDTVRQRQENWLRLFSDLQTVLARAGDAWLEEFQLEGDRQSPHARIALTGKLLLPRDGDAAAREGLDRLLAGLQILRWVNAVENVVILPREGFLQAFHCSLVLQNLQL